MRSWFSGQIGYALVPMIARGVMLGPEQSVILHMLDIPPAAEALNGVKMELVDAAFPLLKGVLCLHSVSVIFVAKISTYLCIRLLSFGRRGRPAVYFQLSNIE